MPTTCPLTRQLYDAVISSNCEFTRLQFLPGADSLQVVEDSENKTLEIGFSKKHYLGIFTEGHSYLNGQYPSKKQMEGFTIAELENMYFATISLILTTNDHSTVWRVHEQALWELDSRSKTTSRAWPKQDLQFCTALATSKLDKINKSPLLWHWMKKMVVFHIFSDYKPEKLLAFLVQIRRSMDAHYANYAAGYTFVWTVKIARFLQKGFDENRVLELIRESCRKSLSDHSLWTAFAGVLNTKSDVHAEEMYRRILGELSRYGVILQLESAEKYEVNKLPQVAEPANDVFDSRCELLQTLSIVEIDWLLDIECLVKLPYQKLMGLSMDSVRSTEALNERRVALEAADAEGKKNAKKLLEILSQR